MQSRLAPSELAGRIEKCFPALTERGRRVSRALHRMLALGWPVPEYAIAATSRLQVVEVQEEMQGWTGVVRSETGRVTAFQGLDLDSTPHRFEVEGRTLYAWCAWAALFLPGVIERAARVTSSCPVTGRRMELLVGPETIRERGASDVAVSMVDPERADVTGDQVVATFCRHIHFFASGEAAGEWARTRGDGIYILTLAAAFELGRRWNAHRFGDGPGLGGQVESPTPVDA
ncbi:MAG: organomercurial lyase [Longimicrobiales bacterium]